MDRMVDPCDLKLHRADKSRLSRRLKLPYEECGGQCCSPADAYCTCF